MIGLREGVGQRSQVRLWFLIVLSMLICVGLVLGASFTSDPLSFDFDIDESTNSYSFDYDVDVSDVSFDVKSSGFDYSNRMTLNSSTGIISIYFSPHSLEKNSVINYPDSGYFTLEVINNSNGLPVLNDYFSFDVSNVNDAPTLNNCSPNNWNYYASDNDPDLRYWDCDEDHSLSDTIVYEGDSYYFESVFRNLDPNPWNETTISWYKVKNGIWTEVISCQNNQISQYGNSYYTGEDYFYSNCSVPFNSSDAGVISVISQAVDDTNSAMSIYSNWTFFVNNTNLPPYFESNDSSLNISGSVSGIPLILMNESDDLVLTVVYNDDDRSTPNPYEFYEVSAYWYVDGNYVTSVQSETSNGDYSDSFTFSPDYYFVNGLNDSKIRNITVVITDTQDSVNMSWIVNVSNIPQIPVIDGIYMNSEEVLTDSESVIEGDNKIFGVNFSDIDSDIVLVNISVDGVVVDSATSEEINSGELLYNNGTWNYSSDGIYNISFYVEDSLGYVNYTSFNLTVEDNLPPDIYYINISSLEHGSNYYEGDTLRVIFNYSDDRDDAEEYSLKLGDTYFVTNQSIGSGVFDVQISENEFLDYTLTGMSDKLFNLTIEVSEAQFTSINVTEILIRHVNRVPYIYEFNFVNTSGQYSVPYLTNGVVSVREGYDMSFTLLSHDENGDGTINRTVFNITGLGINENSNGNSYYLTNYNLGYDSDGFYTVNASIIDEEGLENKTYFYLNVTDNTAPWIDSLTITNSTGGDYFKEGDLLNITFTFSDSFGISDVDTYRIIMDNDDVPVLNRLASTEQKDYVSYNFVLSNQSQGNYNVSAFVYDIENLNGTKFNDTIVVNRSDVNPIISQFKITETNSNVLNPSEGQTVVVEEVNSNIGNNSLTFWFNVSDDDYDLNVSSAKIYIDGISSDFNYLGNDSDYYFYYDYTWNLNFSSNGTHLINISIEDDTGRKNLDYEYFYVNVTDNIAPFIDNITIAGNDGNGILNEDEELTFIINGSDENSNINYYTISFNDSGTVFEGTGILADQSNTYNQIIIFGDNGIYNVTAMVFDTEGKNYSFSKIFEIGYKNRSAFIEDFKIKNTDYSPGIGTNINLVQGVEVPFEVNTYDYDLDTRSMNISVYNDSNNEYLETIFSNNSYSGNQFWRNETFNWTPVNPVGNYYFKVNISGDDGLEKVWDRDFSITPNTPPNITLFNITKEGVENHSLTEEDVFNVNFDYSDIDGNVVNYYIKVNVSDVDLSTVFSNHPAGEVCDAQFCIWNNTKTGDFTLGGNSKGAYNFTVYVEDVMSASDSEYIVVNVSSKEYTPTLVSLNVEEFSGNTYDKEQLLLNQSFKQNYQKGYNVLNFSVSGIDLDDNNTLNKWNITIDGVETNLSLGGLNGLRTGEFLYTLNYSIIGMIPIEIELIDDMGYVNQTTFYLNITNNTIPQINLNLSVDQDTNEQIDEGDTLYLTLNVSDVDNNIDTFYIDFNDGENVTYGYEYNGSLISWSRYFNHTSAGDYTITYFVNDTAGWNDTFSEIITINATEVAPNITDVDVSIRNDTETIDIDYNFESNSDVNFKETEEINITFVATDLNYDLWWYFIFLQGNLKQNGTIEENRPVSWLWLTDYNDTGYYNLTIVVNNTNSSYTDSYTMWLNISNNTAPVVEEFNIIKSGLEVNNVTVNATEGDTLNLFANVSDIIGGYDNLVNVSLLIDGVYKNTTTSLSSAGLVVSYDWYLDYEAAANNTKTYNISMIAYDEEGLNVSDSKLVTVYHTQRVPTIDKIEVQVNGQGFNEAFESDLFTINETNNISVKITASDENGNSTLRNVTYYLIDKDSGTQIYNETLDYSVNLFNFQTTYYNSSDYLINFSINDMDLNSSMSFVNLTVVNNSAPDIDLFTVKDQDGNDCNLNSTCYEGENITIKVNVTDDFSGVHNISLYRNGTYLTNCSDVEYCEYTYNLNYTSRGSWNISVIAEDDEVLYNYSEILFDVLATEVAPEIDRIIINSTLQNRSWVLNSSNFSCSGGDRTDRDCLYIGNSINFSEGDSILVTSILYDVNGNNTLDDTTDATFLYDGNLPKSISSESLTLDWNLVEFERFEQENNGYNFRVMISDESGLNFNSRIDFDVINNVAPVISNNQTLNASGVNVSEITEGSYLNISFDVDDVNLKIDDYYINITQVTGDGEHGSIQVHNTSYIWNLTSDFHARGNYSLTLFANDTEPGMNHTIPKLITVNPYLSAPSLLNFTINNGTDLIFVNSGDTVNTLEGLNLIFNITADDINGEEFLNYSIIRNDSVELLDSSYGIWNINWTQEGYYNVTVNVSDEDGLFNSTYFYLNITNNTVPKITYFNYTSDLANWSDKEFEENQFIYFNYTILDNESNNESHYFEIIRDDDVSVYNNTIDFNSSYQLPFHDTLGRSGEYINYTIVFFVNDSQGIEIDDYNVIERNFTVSPKPTAPNITEPITVSVTGELDQDVYNGSVVDIYESQNVSFSFAATDVNGDIANYSILINGTTASTSNNIEFNTDFNTAGNMDFRSFNVTLRVNDSTSRFDTVNFTIRVENNTAPWDLGLNVDNDDVTLTSETYTFGVDEDEMNLTMKCSYDDNQSNWVTGNLSLFKKLGQSEVLVNSTEELLDGSLITFNHTFENTDRSFYFLECTILDDQGLATSLNNSATPFTFDGAGTPPSILNVTIESAWNYPDYVFPAESFISQQGDEITIFANATHVDFDSKGSYVEAMSIRILSGTGSSLGDPRYVKSDNFGSEKYATLSHTFDLSELNNTDYQIKVEATSDTGKPISSLIQFFTIEPNVRPNITKFNITQGGIDVTQINENSSIKINFTSVDLNTYTNVDSYILKVNDTEIASGLWDSLVEYTVGHNFNFSSAGIYNISLFVNDSLDANDSVWAEITVNAVELDPVITKVEYKNETNQGGWVELSPSGTIDINENENLSLRVTAFDYNDDDTLTYDLNLSGPNGFGSSNSGYKFISWSGDEGLHSLKLNVTDNNGNFTEFLFGLNVIDNTKPNVIFDSVNSSGFSTWVAYEDSYLNFSMTASDPQDNLKTCYIKFDDLVVGSCNSNTGIGFAHVPFTYGDDGVYNVTFYAEDDEGRINETDVEVTVLINERNPVINYVNAKVGSGSWGGDLANGSSVTIYESQSLSFRFNASDLNSNLMNLSFTGGCGAFDAVDDSFGPAYSFQLTDTWLTNFNSAQTCTVIFNAKDVAGNLVWREIDVTVEENLAPSLVDKWDNNSVIYENDTVNFWFTYHDDEGNADSGSIRILLDGEDLSLDATGGSTDGTPEADYKFNFTSRGTHTITYYVEDVDGKKLNASYDLDVLPTNVDPEISIVSVNGQAVSYNEIVEGIAGDVFNIAIFADDLNEPIDTLSYSTGINVSPRYSNYSQSFTWNSDVNNDAGMFEVEINVSDDYTPSGKDSFIFRFNLSDNLPPSVDSIIVENQNLVNCLIGTCYEGDILTVSGLVSDSEGNLKLVEAYDNRSSFSDSASAAGSSFNYEFTWVLNYSSRGTYNLTVNATDLGDSIGSDWINFTINPKEIAPEIISFNLWRDSDTNRYVISSGGKFVDLAGNEIKIQNLNAIDDNYLYSPINRTIILRNGTEVYNSSNYGIDGINDGLLYNYTIPDGVDQNFTIRVYDTENLYDEWNVTIGKGNNTAPNVTNFYVNDSLGGDIKENSTINISFNIVDAEDNADEYIIYFNETEIFTGKVYPGENSILYPYVVPWDVRGLLNVSVNVTDYEGKWGFNESEINVLLNNQNPEIDLVFVNGNQIQNEGDILTVSEGSTATISFTASDLNGDDTINSYSISRNYSVTGVETNVASDKVGSWNISYTSEGIWNITLLAEDIHGGVGSFDFLINVTNNTAPKIDEWFSLNSSGVNTSSHTGGKTITLGFNYSDLEGDVVERYMILNGTRYDGSIENEQYIGNYTQFTLHDLVNGTYDLTFYVRDIQNAVDNLTVQLDMSPSNVAPEIQSVTVSSDLKGSDLLGDLDLVNFSESDSVEFTINAFDANGDLISYEIRKYYNGTSTLIPPITSSKKLTWDIDYDEMDVYRLEFKAIDGVDSNLFDTWNIYVDITNNTAPEIDVLNITNSTGGNYFSEGDELNISFNYSDLEEDYSNSEIYLNSTSLLVSENGNIVSVVVPLNYSSRGWYNVSVFAYDLQPLIGTKFNDSIYVNSTNIPPVIENVTAMVEITLFDVLEGSSFSITENTSVLINFSSYDNNSLDVLNNSVWFDGQNKSWTNYYSFNGSDLVDGQNNISLVVNDSFDLTYYNFTVFKVSNTAPVINSVNFTDSIFREGNNISIIVNASDAENNIVGFNVSLNFSDGSKSRNLGYFDSFEFNFTLPMSSRGNVNLTVEAVDVEGATGEYFNSSIVVQEFDVKPEIIGFKYSINEGSYLDLLEDDVINASEVDSVNVLVVSEDENDNIERYSFVLRKDNNGVFEPYDSEDSASEIFNYEFTYGEEGFYRLRASVFDESSLNDHAYVYMNISDNTPPSIINFTVLNSTYGNETFIETDLLNITVEFNDTEGDFNHTEFYINETYLGSSNSSSVSNLVYSIPYNKSGNYTITVYVFDKEGLNDSDSKDIYINYTAAAPEITPNVRVEITDVVPVEGGVVNISAYANITLSFDFDDPNGNSELTNYYINVTRNNDYSVFLVNESSFILNDTNRTDGLDVYNITYFVNSSDGRYDEFKFKLNNIGHNAPEEFYFNITNLTGGNRLSEGDLAYVTCNVTDRNNDITKIVLLSNRTGNYSEEYVAYMNNFTWKVPYDARGNWSFMLKVYDADPELVTDSENNKTLEIVGSEVNPIILNPKMDSRNLTSEPIIYSFKSGKVNFNFKVEDYNGNETLNYSSIYVTYWNSSNKTKLLNLTKDLNGSTSVSHSWTVPSRLQEMWLNLTYFVEDNSSLNSSESFKIKLIPATVETTTTTKTVKSPSGSSSGSGSIFSPNIPPKTALVEVKNPTPLNLGINSEVIKELVISNPGELDLTNLSLKPIYNMKGVEVEVIEDFNSTLKANGSITVKVRIKNAGDSNDAFNITFDAVGNNAGHSVQMKDSAIMYVNALSTDFDRSVDEYLDLYKYTKRLVQDNLECLELMDNVALSKKRYDEGYSEDAMNLIIEARDTCLKLTRRSYEDLDSVVTRDNNDLVDLIMKSLGILILVLLVPSVVLLLLHLKKKKKSNVDEKEEEVEEWLKEFYDE